MIRSTYNPILREEPYQPSFFSRIPSPGSNSAILLISGDQIGQAMCIRPGSSVKPSDIRKNRYNRLVEIDTGTHNIEIAFSLLSNDNVSCFIVTAGMVAQVTDPFLFYAEKLSNAAERIQGELEPVFQELAETYSIDDISGFRNALRQEVDGFTLTQCGITISGCRISVRGDESYQNHLRKKSEISRKSEIDRAIAASTKQLSGLYPDPVTAILSRVADGSISIVEAMEQIRAWNLADSNQQKEKWDNIINQMIKLRDAGIISEEQLQEKIYPVLDGLLDNTAKTPGRISAAAQEQIAESESSQKAPSEFAPFDEE